MDKTLLVDDYIKDAEKLIKALDAAGFPVNAALWSHDSETGFWKLIIASNEYDKIGPIKSYQSVSKIIDNIEDEIKNISLEDISMVSSSDEFILLLKNAIKTDSKSIAGIRFTSSTINNIYVEDAYIYRLA